ncbi:MAG TPA: histidinol dehydrogenase [Trueperaceae bacterium]
MRVISGKRAAIETFERRGFTSDVDDTAGKVREIVEDVRRRGDEAVREYGQRFDGVRIEEFRVPEREFDEAEAKIDSELSAAIDLAAGRITSYYRHQPAQGFIEEERGDLLGQLVRPLERVGCYVPGGTAPLFSSLLMTAVPAKVAGVDEVIVATPPGRGGSVPAEVLVAARRAGVENVFRIGGAQAIAAMAYGTESVPRVDKVVGPGNRWVVLAKQAVYGAVGIEALPGPTETLVLADGSASVRHVASDLLAQAEHAGAQPVLVTTSRELAEALPGALEEALARLPTAGAARESLEERGYLVLVDDLQEAMEVANAYAPEHLCLLVDDPQALLPLVRNAGGVFLGHRSMEALGDYVLGPSHVMPTGGTARFSSFVNLNDFQKLIPLVGVGEELLSLLAEPAARMARAEGLEAHARAIESRTGSEGE